MSAAAHQASNVAPPRRGAVIALGIDATARAYDLQTLALGGFTPDAANASQVYVFLTLHAEGGDVYYHLSDTNNADVSDTAKVTAGNALAFANTYGGRIPQNGEVSIRINRKQDKYLVVKASSGAPILRFYASSEGF